MFERRRTRAVVVPTVTSCAAHVPLVLVLVRRVVVVSVVCCCNVVVLALVVLLIWLSHLLVLVLPLLFLFLDFCPDLWLFVPIFSQVLGSSIAPSGCTCWCSWTKLQLFPFLQWPFWKNLQIFFPIFSSYFTSVYRSDLPAGFAQPSDVFCRFSAQPCA